MADEQEKLTFEAALGQLEQVVKELETGSLPLEKLIERYESGMEMAKVCRARLETLERKIELLTRDDGAEGSWTDFEPDTGRRTRD